jgi:hypothetical protein
MSFVVDSASSIPSIKVSPGLKLSMARKRAPTAFFVSSMSPTPGGVRLILILNLLLFTTIGVWGVVGGRMGPGD